MSKGEQIYNGTVPNSRERLQGLLKELKQEDIDKFIIILTHLKEGSPKVQNSTLPIALPEDTEVIPSRKTRWVNKISQQQMKRKRMEQIFIADAFVKHGINYHYITQRFPEMSPKTYRCVLEAVNNNAVNTIIHYLRYECNIEIQRMNRDQKRSIRTQLTKVKEWLGNRDMDQLDCFYRFIYKYYKIKQVTITQEEGVRLYTTILSIIKSPTVNVFEEGASLEEVTVCGLQKEEANTLMVLFIKWKDLTKVSDLMCQKYAYTSKYSNLSTMKYLRQLLDASVDKLIRHMKPKEQDEYLNYFTPTNRALLHQVSENNMKISLYSYFMDTKNTYIKVKNLLIKLRDFFDKYAGDMSINVTLPKVEHTTKEEVVKQEEEMVKQEQEISAFQFVNSTREDDSFKSEDQTEESFSEPEQQ